MEKPPKLHGEAGTSRFDKSTLGFVTQNPHKYEEASSILSGYGITLLKISSPKLEIQSESLPKIAKFAAEDAAKRYKIPVVVEDSGLFVEALNGFPGPFSSYCYLTLGVRGLLRLLNHSQDRDAYFEAVLALAFGKSGSRLFSGRVHGTISRKALGKGGFGFDPIFVPIGGQRTFAEGGGEYKEKYSHRAIAFTKLARWYCAH